MTQILKKVNAKKILLEKKNFGFNLKIFIHDRSSSSHVYKSPFPVSFPLFSTFGNMKTVSQNWPRTGFQLEIFVVGNDWYVKRALYLAEGVDQQCWSNGKSTDANTPRKSKKLISSWTLQLTARSDPVVYLLLLKSSMAQAFFSWT